jgi:hypothetical protein
VNADFCFCGCGCREVEADMRLDGLHMSGFSAFSICKPQFRSYGR